MTGSFFDDIRGNLPVRYPPPPAVSGLDSCKGRSIGDRPVRSGYAARRDATICRHRNLLWDQAFHGYDRRIVYAFAGAEQVAQALCFNAIALQPMPLTAVDHVL